MSSQHIKILGVLTSGGDAPGMNTAVRGATRLGVDQCHIMIGIKNEKLINFYS